jgi:tetratricopeptide (TPR) repeat protein
VTQVGMIAVLLLQAAAPPDSRTERDAGPVVVRQADLKSPGYPAYERANALLIANKLTESRAALEEALRLDPKLVPALTLKAKLAMLENRYVLARQTLERALAVAPSSWYAQFLYGLQYYLGNEMQLAQKPLETARRLNPRDPRATVYLGLTYESVGRAAEALTLYTEARRLEEASGESHADTLLIGARLLHLMDRLDESGKWIHAALKLEPESRDVRFELARLLLKKGDARGAIAEGEAALRLSGAEVADRQVHYLLVRAYRATGQDDQASRHAEALRSIDSSDSK